MKRFEIICQKNPVLMPFNVNPKKDSKYPFGIIATSKLLQAINIKKVS